MERDPLVELRDVLLASKDVTDTLLDQLDQDVNFEAIVAHLETLGTLDESRTKVLDRLRREISSLRMRKDDRSTRHYVLDALETLGTPQSTGFLEDFLYATELVEARSRGMGALRRDEYRAWTRRGTKPRPAYIVPCLDEAGREVPHWLSRSDWPLWRRLAVGDAERLWALRRVSALVEARDSKRNQPPDLFNSLIQRYAREVLGDSAIADELPFDSTHLEGAVALARDQELTIEPLVHDRQERLAAALNLDEVRRFWGVDGRGVRDPSERHTSDAVG